MRNIVHCKLNTRSHNKNTHLRPVSRKSRKPFGPEKSIYISTISVKLVFSYVVKGIKIKIPTRFRASRRHGFEDTKKICQTTCTRNVSGLSRNESLGTTVCSTDK